MLATSKNLYVCILASKFYIKKVSPCPPVPKNDTSHKYANSPDTQGTHHRQKLQTHKSNTQHIHTYTHRHTQTHTDTHTTQTERHTNTLDTQATYSRLPHIPTHTHSLTQTHTQDIHTPQTHDTRLGFQVIKTIWLLRQKKYFIRVWGLALKVTRGGALGFLVFFEV